MAFVHVLASTRNLASPGACAQAGLKLKKRFIARGLSAARVEAEGLEGRLQAAALRRSVLGEPPVEVLRQLRLAYERRGRGWRENFMLRASAVVLSKNTERPQPSSSPAY